MDIEVKTGKLREKANEQKKIKNDLAKINTSILGSKKKFQSCLSSSASGSIDRALVSASSGLQKITDDMAKMADGLDMIAQLYEMTEQDISGNTPSEDAITEIENEAEVWTGIKWGEMFLDFWKEIFGSGGIVGAAIKGGLGIFQSENWVETLLNSLKLGNGVVKNVCGGLKKSSWSTALFGDWEVGKAKSFKEALGDEWGEYSMKKSLLDERGNELKETQVFGAKGKVVAKWAGGALTVAEKVVGNVREFGGDNGAEGDVTKGSTWGKAVKEERFWRETATETAIEIGKDILIGAAVVAVVGSGGWVAALATAGVSVALDIGANAIAKNDKGFTENASNWLNDRYEDLIAAKETFKVVTKWFRGNAGFVTV